MWLKELKNFTGKQQSLLKKRAVPLPAYNF